MRKIIVLLVIVCVGAIAFTAGCADSSNGTPTTVPTTQPVQTTATEDVSLVPGPTETLPSQQFVDIEVKKDQIYNTITVEFRGGKGQFAVTRIDVKATLSNGEVIPDTLGSDVGDTVTFNGTDGADRVEVWISFTDGTRYKVYDDLVEGKTRN